MTNCLGYVIMLSYINDKTELADLIKLCIMRLKNYCTLSGGCYNFYKCKKAVGESN